MAEAQRVEQTAVSVAAESANVATATQPLNASHMDYEEAHAAVYHVLQSGMLLTDNHVEAAGDEVSDNNVISSACSASITTGEEVERMMQEQQEMQNQPARAANYVLSCRACFWRASVNVANAAPKTRAACANC